MDPTIAEATNSGEFAKVEPLMKNVYRTGGMDFVALLDGRGTVICRGQNPARRGDDLSDSPLVAEVLRRKLPVAGTILLSRKMLEAEGEELAQRARFELIATPAAHPTPEKFRSEGMVAAAAVPILDAQGRIEAILYGGDLLNRRYGIVDSIKQEVFPREVYEGREIGTVTIFQGDLRIATNVKMEDGSRAVGTRLSATVSDEVLRRGGIWAAPAFVVNDWYITLVRADPRSDATGSSACCTSACCKRRSRTSSDVITWVFLAIVTVATLASLVLLFFVYRTGAQPDPPHPRHVAQDDRRAIFRPASAFARRAKWECSARRSIAWPTPSPNARTTETSPRGNRSAGASSWRRSAAWRRASPTKSTIP